MNIFFRNTTREFVARLFVGSLFALLTINVVHEFLETRHVTGLLLVASESLVVLLTIVRRPARAVDHSAAAAVLTFVSVVGPPLLRPTDTIEALAPDAVTALVSIVGLAIVVAGKVTLGRSFGLIPANRGVVSHGPYSVTRHPIYSGYLLTHVAFLAAHPTPLNVGIALVADTALVLRALREEKVLSADAKYQAYCHRVSWHLVPGVF